MKEESSSLSVPYQFARCLNARCAQAEKCLHRFVALHDISNEPQITIINPNCIPEDGIGCLYLRSAEKIHVAWGMKRLLDELPHKDVGNIRRQLIGHFGKTGYYRFFRGERCLMPGDQAYIRQLFRKKGYGEPAFERYTDEYNW